MSHSKQNLVAKLVTSARNGDREAARGLLLLIRDRQLCGKPVDAEIHEWLSDGVRLYLSGDAATLDNALRLKVPAHRESKARDQRRARRICELMADLLTEWERHTARGQLRFLSDRQAIAILARLSERKPRLRETLARILKNCKPARRSELLDYLLKPPPHPEWAGPRGPNLLPAFCDGVPPGLSADGIKRIWTEYRETFAPHAPRHRRRTA